MKNLPSLITAGALALWLPGCGSNRWTLEKMECVWRESISSITVQQLETAIQGNIVSICWGVASKWWDSAPFTVINTSTGSHFVSEPMAHVIAEPATFRKKN